MNRDTATATVSPARVERGGRLGHRSIVLAALALVILLDQTTKWWAWRHAPGALINYGGSPLVAAKVGDWFADPATGAILDLVDVGLLSLAVSVMVRRPRPTLVLIAGALMVGGWSSNLLDRLGMHYWSAPGSVRGAVDFIPLGAWYYNVADFFIACGTLLFLLAVSQPGARAAMTPAVSTSLTPATPRRPRVGMRMTALAGGVALAVVVGIGAAHHNGLTAPPTAFGASTDH
jgi:lipoprotein signal peptidase